jgi:hypothetical protein
MMLGPLNLAIQLERGQKLKARAEEWSRAEEGPPDSMLGMGGR